MRWRLTGLAALHWLHLDGDWVVYDEGSGQTLALDSVTAGSLMALEGGCSQLADIAAQVRQDLQCEDGVLPTEQVAEGLAFLNQIGLIEPQPV